MEKIKLMTIVGTRPEIIRLSAVIKKCDRYFNQLLVHTGQNYDYTLNQIFFEDLELRAPDFYLNAVGSDLGETIGNIIAKSYALMAQQKPDALLILGDTNSCLSAIAAKRLHIPIFHMEAGNRCFDENLPEEVNRRIVDTTSDVNLCYTEHARRNLLNMGCATDRTFVVGSPMREVLQSHAAEIEASDVLGRLRLEPRQYLLLSVHREDNVDDSNNLKEVASSFNALAQTYQVPLVYSMHPRARNRIEESGITFDPLVRPMKPFGFCDYVRLQKNALCVISDSGTLAEESGILGFPAVSLRTSTERPEAVDRGAFTIGGITSERLLQSVQLETSLPKRALCVPDYLNTRTSSIVARIIQGYVDVINATVWGRRL